MIDIIYLNIKHPEWQQVSIATLNQHLLNKGTIFTLDSNQSLFQFLRNNQTTQKVMIIEQNMGLLKDVNIQNIPITYQIINSNYIQDHIKPQVIKKDQFLKLQEKQYQFPLSEYFRKMNRVGFPNNSFVVNVTKPICCSIKSLLTIRHYINWNQKSFQSVKKYLQL